MSDEIDKNQCADEHLELTDIPESRYGRRVLFALRRVIRAIDIYSRKLVSEHQITGPQLVCLNSIVETGPITATDLAYQVHLSASTVVRIVDKLESRGLVQRQRQLDDRRRVHVTATVAGHELSAKAPYSDKHPLRKALRQLPTEQQDTIASLLENLVDLMDAQALSTSPVIEVGSICATPPNAPAELELDRCSLASSNPHSTTEGS
ncbi:MAG: MarR family transcriptional regulator [bacterium]